MNRREMEREKGMVGEKEDGVGKTVGGREEIFER